MISVCILTLPIIGNTQIHSYNSFVDTNWDVYFKVLDLENLIVYNFTIDVEDYYQMDVGFSIHLSNKPKERNALVTIDESGQEDESTLYTPDISSDYYIRVFSNYNWGFFDIIVKENLTGIEKIVEPYNSPINWSWLWIPAIVVGSVMLLSLLFGFLSNIGVFNIRNIRFPRIKFNGTKIVRRIKKRRYERLKRRVIRKEERKARREEKEKEKLRVPIQLKQKRKVRKGVEIIFVSNKQPRCMVSGLNINFNEDEVVACPECGNMAKKPLLIEWLKVKGICPICRKNIIIEDCLKAEYKEN